MAASVYAFVPNKHLTQFNAVGSSTSLGYSNGINSARLIPLHHRPGIGKMVPATPKKRHVTEINGENELIAFVNEDKRLCVIKVYACWCKTCKSFDIRYRKLARRLSSHSGGSVRFGEIEFVANEALCHALGATRLPYIIMCRGSEKLTDFQCGPSKFQRVIDTVSEYVGGKVHTHKARMVHTHAAGDGMEKYAALMPDVSEETNGRSFQQFASTHSSAVHGAYRSAAVTEFEKFCRDQTSKRGSMGFPPSRSHSSALSFMDFVYGRL